MTGMSEKRIVPPLEESPLAPKSSTPAISPRRAGPLYYGIYAQFLRQSAPFKGTDVLKAALAQGDKEHYQINNFDILEKIGVGAYGKVLKVKHKDTGRILAMKCVNVGHLGKQRQLEALNEVQVLKGLRHQNIITYWGSFIEGNKLCILMELATNGDLMHVLYIYIYIYIADTETKREEMLFWREGNLAYDVATKCGYTPSACK